MKTRELWVSSELATFTVVVKEDEDPLKSVIIEAAPIVRYKFKGQILQNLVRWLDSISAGVKICTLPLTLNDTFRMPKSFDPFGRKTREYDILIPKD